MRTTISTTIDLKHKELAQKLNIPMSKILEFGIQFLIADLMNDPSRFPHPHNTQTQKLERAMIRLQEVALNGS